MLNMHPAHLNKGFTYLAILFAIAIMGIALAAAGTLWHVTQKREKERDLLYIGNQYRQAIALYYERTPGGSKQFPKSLENLLQDNRQLTPQRYLRKLFRDPITNSKTWGLVAGPGNSIMGIYSLSEDTPMKRANFNKSDSAFTDAQHYSDWKFVYATQSSRQGLPVQGLPVLK